jgi:hypothetical protein
MSRYFKCYIYDINKWIEIDTSSITIFKIGLFGILIVFLILIRPIFLYFMNEYLCKKTNDTYLRSHENKGVQCCIDSNLHKIVINPDDSFTLLEDTCMEI